MRQSVDTILKACKCGCGKQFVLKRKDQLFYPGHKGPYNKKIYDVGKELLEKFGSDVSVESIQKVDSEPLKKKSKKKKWHPGKIETSPRLQRLAKLLNRGGKHSTRALQNRKFVAVSTMINELRWNFLVRKDLPKEYNKYKGMHIITSTKRIKKTTVWFYKLESKETIALKNTIKTAVKDTWSPLKASAKKGII